MSAECAICETTKNKSKFEVFPCDHLFCKRCLKENFEKLLRNPSTIKSSFVCLENECETLIPKNIIVSNIEEDFVKIYEKLKDRIEKIESTKVCSCCAKEKKRDRFIKLECKHSFCKRCLILYFKGRIKKEKFRFKCLQCFHSISPPIAKKILIEKQKYLEKFLEHLKSQEEKEEEEEKKKEENSNKNIMNQKKNNKNQLKNQDSQEKSSSSENREKLQHQPSLERYKRPPFPIESPNSKKIEIEFEIQDQNKESKKKDDDGILSENSDPFDSDIEGLIIAKNDPKPPKDNQIDTVTPITAIPEISNCDIKCTQCQTQNDLAKYKLSCEHYFCQNCILIFLRVLINKSATFICKVCKLEMDTNKLPNNLLSMFDTFFDESLNRKTNQKFEKINENLWHQCFKCKKKNEVKPYYKYFVCTFCNFKTEMNKNNIDNSNQAFLKNNQEKRDISANNWIQANPQKNEKYSNSNKNDHINKYQKEDSPQLNKKEQNIVNNKEQIKENLFKKDENWKVTHDDWKFVGTNPVKDALENVKDKQQNKRNDPNFFQEKNFNPHFKSENLNAINNEEEKKEKDEPIFEVMPQSNELRCKYCFETITFLEIEKAYQYHDKEKCSQRLKQKESEKVTIRKSKDQSYSSKDDSYYTTEDDKTIVCSFCQVEMPMGQIDTFLKIHGLKCKKFMDKSNIQSVIHSTNNVNQFSENILYEDEHNNVVCKICKKCLKVTKIEAESNLHGIGICGSKKPPEKGGRKDKK